MKKRGREREREGDRLEATKLNFILCTVQFGDDHLRKAYFYVHLFCAVWCALTIYEEGKGYGSIFFL